MDPKNVIEEQLAATLETAVQEDAPIIDGALALAPEVSPDGDKPAKSKSKKAAAKSGSAASGGKVKFIPGSGETAAQRTARLKRECKGAVDAGACSGYTR